MEPFQANIPNEIKFSDEQRNCVDFEIQGLLKKGAIVQSEWEQNQFISNIFIVPKPNGRFRPIINLKYLNYFVSYEHIKQGYDQQRQWSMTPKANSQTIWSGRCHLIRTDRLSIIR